MHKQNKYNIKYKYKTLLKTSKWPIIQYEQIIKLQAHINNRTKIQIK